mmetsp:Transcript_40654/g.132808  ORF Transcript_40654/g.132808 Transcript_40654/m.132808 type:complete len:211 (+) Transcript_40654:136-768(+)
MSALTVFLLGVLHLNVKRELSQAAIRGASLNIEKAVIRPTVAPGISNDPELRWGIVTYQLEHVIRRLFNAIALVEDISHWVPLRPVPAWPVRLPDVVSRHRNGDRGVLDRSAKLLFGVTVALRVVVEKLKRPRTRRRGLEDGVTPPRFWEVCHGYKWLRRYRAAFVAVILGIVRFGCQAAHMLHIAPRHRWICVGRVSGGDAFAKPTVLI